MVYKSPKIDRLEHWEKIYKKEKSKKIIEMLVDLEFEATHDHLTGILNRKGILENCNRVLDVHLRDLKNNNRNLDILVTCIFLDLKGLKLVNTKEGEEAGDILIKRASKIIGLSARRGMDIAGRWGGDEFAILLIDPSSKSKDKIIERILSEGNKNKIYFHIGTSDFKVTEDVETKVLETGTLMEESKKLEKKDSKGRLIANKTTFLKV